jgi:hypothetical protein
MVNGDHRNSGEENSSGESIEAISPTQKEIIDADLCE